MRLRVIGVNEVAAPEPCHLVEILIDGGDPTSVVESITQEDSAQPRENWQVAYDQQYLTADGARLEQHADVSAARVAFFFHQLDVRRPLMSSVGPITLPPSSALPARPEFIRYEPPC